MSITDELREWVRDGKGSLLAIADRIDAAYHAAYQDGENAILAVLDKRGNADVDKTMAEHGWYRALDADKKPIHLDDKVYQVKGGWVYTVKSISFYPDNTTVTFGCEHGFGSDNAHNLRHYHEPTVEDVLREFADEMNENLGMYTGEAIDADEWRDADAKTVEKFAAKLRLAEVEDV